MATTQELLNRLINVDKAVPIAKKRPHHLNFSQTETEKDIEMMRCFLNDTGADPNEIFGNPVTVGMKLKEELLELRPTVWFGFNHEMVMNMDQCIAIYSSLLKDNVKNIFMFQNKKTQTIIHQCPKGTSTSQKCKCRFNDKFKPPMEYTDKHKNYLITKK